MGPSVGRRAEVKDLLARLSDWAATRADIIGIALVGSWARGEARHGSDVDLAMVSRDPGPYVGSDEWLSAFPGCRVIVTRAWGPMLTERRIRMPSGLEIEIGIADPAWARVAPVDEGTRQVVLGGFEILHDPDGQLDRLLRAVQRRTYTRRMATSAQERAAKLEGEADRLCALLVERGASLVVVFGSFARGTVRESSDLDMLAVMESDLPFISRLQKLYDELQPRVGLDLLVYTPAEFEEMRERSFVREALDEGHVLHAA